MPLGCCEQRRIGFDAVGQDNSGGSGGEEPVHGIPARILRHTFEVTLLGQADDLQAVRMNAIKRSDQGIMALGSFTLNKGDRWVWWCGYPTQFEASPHPLDQIIQGAQSAHPSGY